MKKIILFFGILSVFTAAIAQDRTDSLHIHHYDIHLNITDFTNKQLRGFAELTAVARVNNLPAVQLDLKQLTVDSVIVNEQVVTNFQHQQTLLNIPLQNPANENDTLLVRVYYHGTPARDTHFGGFYFSGEYCYNIGCVFHDYPHIFGRAWYPCLDFFTDKSRYNFHIETEAAKRAICGGFLKDSIVTDSNTIIWQWQLDNPIPTYLASVAVGNYLHYSDTVQGLERIIPIDIYTYPAQYSRIAGTFVHLKEAFHAFEEKYGAYRWNRIGYVGTDFNSGAMEHATNIVIPNVIINGNTTYESLYIHELSHHWFGNLITCQRGEEMWLNEGFARYSEAVADERLYPSDDPNSDGYKVRVRDIHREVLQKAHIDDDGYWALDSVPAAVTYGSTSYDKGALIVHALRNYMGDSAFFPAVQAVLSHYAYQNINTIQLFDFLSQYSGQSLQDFYEGVVHQPGFLHFSIDSICPVAYTPDTYRFYVRQRLSNATYFANSNKIDITFVADNQFVTIENFMFDGEFGTGTVTLPFAPDFAIVDFYEKLADAVVDYNFTVTSTGTKTAAKANVKILINSVIDTAFVRVEDHYVAPDPLKTPNDNITQLSTTHFWRIVGTPDQSLAINVRFTFKGNENNMDYWLAQGHTLDDILLLYREDAAHDWRIVSCNKSGSNTLSTSYFAVDNALFGEYTFAVGTVPSHVSAVGSFAPIAIYPNPSTDTFNLQCNNPIVENTVAKVYDMQGRLIVVIPVVAAQTAVNTRKWKAGTYLLKVFVQGNEVAATKIVVQK